MHRRSKAAQTAVVVLALLVCAAAHAIAADVGPSVIYGDDDRVDLYEVTDPRVLRLADSTVVLFSERDVSIDPSGTTANLHTSQYGASNQLCREEPFYDQPTAGFCSGSLVAPDIIMTAGHCVTSQYSCSTTKFIFGFAIHEEGVYPETVPAGDVYGCKDLIAREQQYSGADWALIRLDRPVGNRKPLSVNRSGTISDGTPLFVIGHPAALPTKVAGGAKVRDSSPEGHFVANLDTYGGNSGSAVFNGYTGLIEGILVRGEVDYVWQGNCRVSNVCPDDGCSGEDVTKISALSSLIPVPGNLTSAARKNPGGDDFSQFALNQKLNPRSFILNILETELGEEYSGSAEVIYAPEPTPIR